MDRPAQTQADGISGNGGSECCQDAGTSGTFPAVYRRVRNNPARLLGRDGRWTGKRLPLDLEHEQVCLEGSKQRERLRSIPQMCGKNRGGRRPNKNDGRTGAKAALEPVKN